MTTKTPAKDKATPEAPGESKPQDVALAGASPSGPPPPAAASAPSNTPEPEPEPELSSYTVTGRSDVLHNGRLYREGDDINLSDADAAPLLKRGHVLAEGR